MLINIKYRQLKAFVLVAETGSFKAAAERLSITQPSLSTLVKELELDVGVDLFDRSTRRGVLTETGQRFLEEIKSVLDRLEEAYLHVKEVGRGSRGRLSLAVLPSLSSGLITERLALFRRRFPGVRIKLLEGRNDHVMQAVRASEVEVGIGSMLLPDDELSFERMFTDHLMIVVPAGHPLERKSPVWQSLEKFDLILTKAGPAEHAMKAHHIQMAAAYEVEQPTTALAMVRRGMGVTVLPSSIAPELNLNGLVCRPIRGSLAIRRLGLISRKNARLSAPALAFAAMLRADGSSPDALNRQRAESTR